MVSTLSSKQITETFKKRMELLGKSAFGPTGDGEDGEAPVVQKPKGRQLPKWTKENAQEQEYKALLSEGKALYHRNEYHRAIEAFTKAADQSPDNSNRDILIDRADCYIQVGKPELALEDVNKVLQDQPKNPRAILTKAEAYFSMGEFEFALVFFQRGLSIRKDMSGFRDGVTKSKHAILDSINGEELFQPNPNYATSRPRKPLVEVKARTIKTDDTPGEEDEAQKKKNDTTRLLPEKVAPLATTEQKSEFLGELSLDYEFLQELQSELNNPPQNNTSEAEEHGKKEDEEIKKIVDDALDYLDQRGAFWSQQGKKYTDDEEGAKERSIKKSNNRTSKTNTTKSSPQSKTASVKKSQKTKTAHYEMSKIQQYEAKYGTAEDKA